MTKTAAKNRTKKSIAVEDHNDAKVSSPKKKTTTKSPNVTKSEKSLVSIKAGGGVKRRPLSKKLLSGNREARKAIATGDVANQQEERKRQQDLRTLYVKFPEGFPTEQEIGKLHSDVKQVRCNRQAKDKDTTTYKYCFLEFASEEACVAAHRALALKDFKGGQLTVDFVGVKSKHKSKAKSANKKKMTINPTRLFVSGLVPKLTAKKLRQLFPKSTGANVPTKSVKKGMTHGFVQFATPAEAKAAFDASKGLEIDGHQMTVLFAKTAKKGGEKEDRKRSLEGGKEREEEGKKAKKDEDESDEEQGEESEEEENNAEKEEESGEEEESEEEDFANDEESGEDEEVENDDDD